MALKLQFMIYQENLEQERKRYGTEELLKTRKSAGVVFSV